MAKASVLDRIRELDAQKAQIIDEAKTAALANAEAAIAELNELGFNYHIVEGGRPSKTTSAPSGKRRTGIRDEVLDVIKKAGAEGISRADLLARLDATDKADQQAVSNAVSALKKAGNIAGEKGIYTTA